MLKLLPSWITSARTVESTCASATTCAPVDCEPIENMSFLDGLGEGEDSCWRSASVTSQLKQLSGVSGEGDRQADERSPFSQAFFTHKPPAVPLWLAAIETGLPSESTQPSKPVAEADAANSPQVPQSVPQQPSAISTDSTKKNSQSRIHRRHRRLVRETIMERTLSVRAPAAAGSLAIPSHPRLPGLQTREVCEPTNQTPTNSTSVTGAPSLQLVSDPPAAPASYPGTATEDSRSIAVQAHLFQEADKAPKAGLGSHGPEEWVSDARALRDSHVRLVVRQLCHIELLNRAIDGFAPSDSSDDVGTDAQAPAAPRCVSKNLVL